MDPFNLVAALVMAVAEVVLVILLIRSLCCSGRVRRYTEAAVRLSKSALHRIVEICRSPAPATDEEKAQGIASWEQAEVHEQAVALLERRAVQYARSAIIVAGVTCALRVPFAIQDIFNDTPVFRPGGMVVVAAVITFVALGCLRMSLVNGRTMLLWHMGFMIALCVVQSPLGCTSTEALAIHRAPFAVVSISLSLFYLKVRVLAVSHACLSLCVIASHASELEPLPGVFLRTTLISELMVCSLRVCLFWCLESLLYIGAHQEVQAKMGRCHRSAVSALLGMTCDAVVETDSDLRMKEHEESLSGLLMHGAGRSLAGTSIKTCVITEPDGQDVFQQNIDKNTRGLSPGLFRGRLRDALGNGVRVTVYRVPYHSVSGKVHHLIGLHEEGDEGRDRRSRWPAGTPMPPDPPEGVLSEDIQQSLAAAGASGGSPTASSNSSASSVPDGHTLTVDLRVEEGLPVDGCTANFRTTFGCERNGVCFTDALGGEGERLLAWIRERMALRAAGMPSASHVESFGEVSLVAFDRRTRLGTRSLKVLFPAQPPEDGSGYVSIRIGSVRRGRGAMGSGTSAEGTPQQLGQLTAGRLAMSL